MALVPTGAPSPPTSNAGKLLDFNAELEMWTRAGHITIELDKKIDIRRLDTLIAWAVLNA